LGRLYLKGSGVPQNEAEAVKLLQRAAEQKNAEAQYLLGRIYWEGRGVPRRSCAGAYVVQPGPSTGACRRRQHATSRATEMDQHQLVEAQRLAVGNVKSK
jgi:TPR repeat protein